LGTPLYMSPEQIEGRVADADAATDQFALAAIAYEMLTGRNPFQAATVEAVFVRVLHRDPAPMGIGQDVEAVVLRGLAKSNGQRFPSVTDFSDALRAAATGRARNSQRMATVAYAAGEVANFQSKGRSRRRNWGLTLAAAVGASLAISLFVGAAANRRSSLVRARSAAPPPTAFRPSVEPLGAEAMVLPAGEEIEAPQELVPPVVVVLPARDRRPIRHSLPPVASPLPVDGDWTMPASEP